MEDVRRDAGRYIWNEAGLSGACGVFLGVVSGEIISTINHAVYDNRRLLVVDRVDERGEPSGGYVIAIAATDAGVGDRVLIVDEGNGARQIVGDPKAPIRSVVVGVVDAVELGAM